MDREPLHNVLKRLPVPLPRPGFVDAAIARAVAPRKQDRSILVRWEMWFGVAVGVAASVLVTVFLLRPVVPADEGSVTLAIAEARNIDVVIDSERALDQATIRIATTGAIELNGFDNNRQVQWQTRLDRGRNVVSLPIVARSAGAAQLVATIEHQGRTRRVAVKMLVKPPRAKVA